MLIRRIIKRTNSLLVRNFVKSLAPQKAMTIEAYRHTAQELARRIP